MYVAVRGYGGGGYTHIALGLRRLAAARLLGADALAVLRLGLVAGHHQVLQVDVGAGNLAAGERVLTEMPMRPARPTCNQLSARKDRRSRRMTTKTNKERDRMKKEKKDGDGMTTQDESWRSFG